MIGRLAPTAQRALFIVSILLNAALIGLVASHWGPTAKAPSAKTEASLTIDRYFASLPEPARSRFIESFERQKEEIIPTLTRVLEARLRIAALLREPALDKDSTEAAFAELREANVLAQGPLHRVLIEAASTLPPEERVRLLHLDYGFSRDWRKNFGLEEETGKELPQPDVPH